MSFLEAPPCLPLLEVKPKGKHRSPRAMEGTPMYPGLTPRAAEAQARVICEAVPGHPGFALLGRAPKSWGTC